MLPEVSCRRGQFESRLIPLPYLVPACWTQRAVGAAAAKGAHPHLLADQQIVRGPPIAAVSFRREAS